MSRIVITYHRNRFAQFASRIAAATGRPSERQDGDFMGRVALDPYDSPRSSIFAAQSRWVSS